MLHTLFKVEFFIIRLKIWLFDLEKVTNAAVATKDTVVAGEKVVEEKLVAAKDTVAGEWKIPHS